MGILTNALVIAAGCFVGGRINKDKGKLSEFRVLGIAIIIVSIIGFFENIFSVEENYLSGTNMTVVLFAYMIGTKMGELFHLEDFFSNLGKTDNARVNAVIDAFLYFGVGGMQICGPIELALNGDNTQLFIKSAVDLPFALVFGAAYGTAAALSPIPVALIQAAIAVLAYISASLFSETAVSQICAMGYLILFFSGYNLISNQKNRISNINMLPSLLLVLFFNIIKEFFV